MLPFNSLSNNHYIEVFRSVLYANVQWNPIWPVVRYVRKRSDQWSDLVSEWWLLPMNHAGYYTTCTVAPLLLKIRNHRVRVRKSAPVDKVLLCLTKGWRWTSSSRKTSSIRTAWSCWILPRWKQCWMSHSSHWYFDYLNYDLWWLPVCCLENVVWLLKKVD